MKTFWVADSSESLRRNGAVEIMASGFEEARDKAEALGVPCRVEGFSTPDGTSTFGGSFYTISDGNEEREMECEDVWPATIEGLSDEEPVAMEAPLFEGNAERSDAERSEPLLVPIRNL